MKTHDEIRAMVERLEGNIHEHGWDSSVNSASRALQWALGEQPGTTALDRYMARPDAERRREWIARGGDPSHWPDAAANEGGS